MCEPVSLTMGALAVTSAAVSYKSQSDAASAANETNQANYKKNMTYAEQRRAFEARKYRENMQQNRLRMAEEQMRAGFEAQDIQRQGREAMSQANVAFGERGVGGVTADLVKGDISRQAAEAETMVGRNLESTMRQLEKQGEGMAIAPVNDPNMPAHVQGPSALAAGLNAASGVVGAASMYQNQSGKSIFGGPIGGGTGDTTSGGTGNVGAPTQLVPQTSPYAMSPGAMRSGSTGKASNSTIKSFGLY